MKYETAFALLLENIFPTTRIGPSLVQARHPPGTERCPRSHRDLESRARRTGLPPSDQRFDPRDGPRNFTMPQSGFVLGLDPDRTASKMLWLTAIIESVSEETMLHAPRRSS